MNRLAPLVALGLAGLLACGDATIQPLPLEPALAKGGKPVARPLDFTITDAGMSLTSDGKGIYQNGVCGVLAGWPDIGMHLSPAGGSIPKSQKAACTGIAPRRATLVLAVRHLSDDPHVDDTPSSGSGAFDVQNVKFGFGAAEATTINSLASCGTAGLRFTSVTYPGSDNTVREDLGGGLWHLYTRPWPDNKAYCENGGSVTFWHVSLDLYVQEVGS